MLKYGLNDREMEVIKLIFSSYPAINEIVIFGSRALGTFKTTSDIDFAIKGDFECSIIASLLADFEESDLIYEVDIVDYCRISSKKLLEHIDEYGSLLQEGYQSQLLVKKVASN